MTTNELKPCPFCGGEPTIHEGDWCEHSEWNCVCGTCGAGTSGDTNREQAIAFWNRRPILTFGLEPQMTSNDEWVNERALAVLRATPPNVACRSGECDPEVNCSLLLGAIADFGHEAIERGKAEQDKAVDEAKRQQRIVDSHYRQQHDANLANLKRAEAAEAKLARLENPDEALVEAAFHAFVPAVNFRESLKLAIRALARTLKENSDAKK